MATQWTPSQQLAIRHHGSDLLISAAAGSGKTATLTERIIRSLIGNIPDEDGNLLPPADISRMLIVTFTRAAAAELRSRISAALSAAIAADPQNHHLYRQLLALGSADICTIDSFYLQPVRANFERLGLPSSFRLADDSELLPLKQETMKQQIDAAYTRHVPAAAAQTQEEMPLSVLDGNAFAAAMDDLLPNRDRGESVDVLLALYERLLAYPEGLTCLLEQSQRKAAQADLPFCQTDEGRTLCAYLIERLTSLSHRISHACDVFAADEVAALLYLPGAVGDLEAVSHVLLCLQTGNWDKAGDALRDFAPVRLGVSRKKKAGEAALAIKEQRSDWVKEFRSFASYFADDDATRRAEMKQSAQTERMLYELLSDYDVQIRELKRQRGIQDFTDVRRALFSLLLDADGSPTDVSLSLRDRYDAIYIDEYQDIDTIQDVIFSTIGNKGNRFMVGDIKQSIYSFRAAEPAIFAKYRREMTTITPEHPQFGATGACLFMSENFRCDASVIDFTNAVCGYTFEACAEALNYRHDDDLICGKKTPDDRTPAPVQIVLLSSAKSAAANGEEGEKSPDLREHAAGESERENNGEKEEKETEKIDNAEARYIADEIHRLIQTQRLNDGSPIRPCHIAVLLRAMTAAPSIHAALAAYGIETTLQAATTLATHPDMIALINLLSVIDNPRDDVPLTALLSDPASPLSLEDLLILRTAAPEYATIPLFDLLQLATDAAEEEKFDGTIAARCASFVSFVKTWQSHARALPIDQLLRKLYGEPFLKEKASTPVYLAVYDTARHYQNHSFCGLYQFLRYFRQLLQQPNALRGGGAAENHRDAVTLLSIHKSKGLEFPVVFVANCASSFSDKDWRRPVIFDHELGAAARIAQDADARRKDSVVRLAITTKLRVRQTEEEMRILYVAMTRARERLYLTASIRGNVDRAIERADRPTRGDRAAILSAKSYLSWILGAIAPTNRAPGMSDCYRLVIAGTAEPTETTVSPPLPDDLPAHAASSRPAPGASPFSAYYRDILEAHRQYHDPNALLRTLPTKAAASKLKHDLLDHAFLPERIAPSETDAGEEILPPEQQASNDTETVRRRIELLQSTQVSFAEMLLKKSQATAAERGTATHLFLQYCDHHYLASHGVEAEILRLVEQKYLTRHTADILNRRHLQAFVQSELFDEILHADKIYRELQFNRFLPYRMLTTRRDLDAELGDASLYVQGSLDLVMTDREGKLTLCDYKTDRLRADDWGADLPACQREHAVADQLIRDHGDQLAIYADAVEGMFGTYPDRILIYSLPLGRAVTFPTLPR